VIKIECYRVALPLKKRFAVSRGSANIKMNVLTVLNGRYCGEGSGSVYYGPTVDEISADTACGSAFLSELTDCDLGMLAQIDAYQLLPAARSALMGMVLNYLSGKSKRKPWELLSLTAPREIRTSMTFGIDNPEKTIKEINESPFPIIKIKMGSVDDLRLVDLMKDIRGKEIRVDANGGWDLATADKMISLLAGLGVRIIEQPTEVTYIAEWRLLKGRHPSIELIVDEGLNCHEDYLQFSPYCDGINIKMEKCGGILQGIRIADEARRDGKKVMLGCMVGSSVLMAQAVYMSSLADYWDLDGPLLLEKDIAHGISYDNESIVVDHLINGGPTLFPNIVENCAIH